MSYFVRLFPGEKNWKLNMLITSPNCSARAIGAAGPLEEGDIIHLLQADNWSPDGKGVAMRFCVLSMDPLKQKYWGPYLAGSHWRSILENYDVSDLIHIHGFQKVVLGDKNFNLTNKYAQTNRTKFLDGLPVQEWQIVWDILNKVRTERIKHRVANPRKDRRQRFEDDLQDAFLARATNRVNAILNEQLFWGVPMKDNYYLHFNKSDDEEVFEKKE